MPNQRVPPPLYDFEDGPAAGQHLVFASISGELPAFTVVGGEHGDAEHVYERIDRVIRLRGGSRKTTYRYVRTIDSDRTRITCPRCGRTSYNPHNVYEGFCGNCHDWTRVPRYAVIRAAEGVGLPNGDWEGRWVEYRAASALRLPGCQLVATGEYERGVAGAHAEVFEARLPDPEAAQASLR